MGDPSTSSGQGKVMAVVGSRTESAGMQAETTKATNKALSAGWRVSTGGARGTDATAIRAAVDAGNL
jgi:predicted Rossmann fold nucleotide-binding protein DprA/Smf involved in DNA uptake